MAENNTKRCPLCFEEIHMQAIKCKHCNSMLKEDLYQNTQTKSTKTNNTLRVGPEAVKFALGDKYEILEEIGHGGMATVYKAL